MIRRNGVRRDQTQVCPLFNYGLSCLDLRYFNAFGPRQDPTGGCAAVIPKRITMLLRRVLPRPRRRRTDAGLLSRRQLVR